jgi:hypothetical protein
MVAVAMSIPTQRIEVTVEGDLVLRGTLGTSKDVPVGFEDIRLHFAVDALRKPRNRSVHCGKKRNSIE